ncbi:MAG: LacI family DNA-binding transcriptional regulator [Candidatus Omnitrophota bacterium]
MTAKKARKKIANVCIDDVAKRAGVSITTVSRVINKNPCVKVYNKDKVDHAIAELGFRPNMSARRLAGGKINTIGLILPRFEDMFHTYYVTEVIRGVCDTASNSGLDVLIHLTAKDLKPQSLGTHLDNVSLCSGVIFADIQGNEDLLREVIGTQTPCVVMNHLDYKLAAACVSIDNKGGSIKAVDHIVSLGHKRIACITGDLGIQAGKERLEGYKESLKRHGIEIDKALIKRCDFSPQRARKAAVDLLGIDEHPTAIFAASDEMAVETVRALREKKLKVPQDISVIGFDDSWFATQGPIGITTVRQPLALMAEKSVAVLLDMIQSKGKASLARIVLPTELVIRETCVSPLKQEDFY